MPCISCYCHLFIDVATAVRYQMFENEVNGRNDFKTAMKLKLLYRHKPQNCGEQRLSCSMSSNFFL